MEPDRRCSPLSRQRGPGVVRTMRACRGVGDAVAGRPSGGSSMAKYRIAWMPGDGIGVDVMDATRIVLDALKLDAFYHHADIGWDFWCKEGNPLPDRTIKTLKETDCALFGAITSKPQDEARQELE